MQVHYGLENISKLPHTVVTSGTFDGVHIGHQKILQRIREIVTLLREKEHKHAESVVITYHPHPRLVLFPDQANLFLLSTLDEKINLMEKYGVEHLLVIPFDKEFSQTSSKDFIQNILINKLNTKKLVIGYDHRFGKNREGSFEYLQANQHLYPFEIEEIPRQDIDNVAISSTKIRNALIQGKIDVANEYLGHLYMLSGQVVKGNQIGRTIDYPTANIAISEKHKLIPADGIYAVKVIYNELIYKGMLYIGSRTTLGKDLQRTIEVNIFDFDKMIYGENLSVELVALLRQEMKFNSIDEMKVQLDKDKEVALYKLAQI
ncbi:MAG: bifunctional riboflavin kinase/FAD synthetase [Thermoflexibacter sp.]